MIWVSKIAKYGYRYRKCSVRYRYQKRQEVSTKKIGYREIDTRTKYQMLISSPFLHL
ncbi:hypothetical protein Hanom_Chr16g01512551 [Helianthus anomalus]